MSEYSDESVARDSQDPEEEVTIESEEYSVEDEMLADVDELVSSGLIGDDEATSATVPGGMRRTDDA